MKWKKDYHDEKRGRTKAPFSGLVDRDGLPTDLATAETSALRSLSPRRNRWPEILKFDERVAELQQRQTGIAEAMGELREKLRLAPAADTDALATWIASGERGPRPEATATGIEDQVTRAEADYSALTRATEAVLAEKATYVERHRVKLVQQADRSTEAAHRRVNELIDQLAAAREELADQRQSALWAALFPAAEAGQSAGVHLVAGGLRAPVEQALGLTAQVEMTRLIDLLRTDADVMKTVQTRSQRAALDGADAHQADDDDFWIETEAGRKLDRERERERERTRKQRVLSALADPYGRAEIPEVYDR